MQDDAVGPKSGGHPPSKEPSFNLTAPGLHVTDFPGCAATQRGRDGEHQGKHRTPMVSTVPRLPGTQAIGPRRRGDRDGQKSGRPPQAAPDSARPTLSGMPLAEGCGVGSRPATGRHLQIAGRSCARLHVGDAGCCACRTPHVCEVFWFGTAEVVEVVVGKSWHRLRAEGAGFGKDGPDDLPTNSNSRSKLVLLATRAEGDRWTAGRKPHCVPCLVPSRLSRLPVFTRFPGHGQERAQNV